ncbi:NrdJb [Methylophilaceae bacterium]|nr:NrdJb [Methylophilaceae bacterium]
MSIKIEKKIVSYSVVDKKDEQKDEQKDEKKEIAAEVVQIGEPLARPDKITGSTYKVKTPVTEHALYITINDVIMNEATDQEHRRPFEIFVNSKNMEHFQWIVGLTRVMSAVFRKGGDLTFLIEELESVFDPNGGYYKKGGKYVPSLVAELGQVLEEHLKNIGMLKATEPEAHQQQLIDDKKAEYLKKNPDKLDDSGFPKDAQLCNKCQTKAAIMMDGCLTCLNCGESKCG